MSVKVHKWGLIEKIRALCKWELHTGTVISFRLEQVWKWRWWMESFYSWRWSRDIKEKVGFTSHFPKPVAAQISLTSAIHHCCQCYRCCQGDDQFLALVKLKIPVDIDWSIIIIVYTDRYKLVQHNEKKTFVLKHTCMWRKLRCLVVFIRKTIYSYFGKDLNRIFFFFNVYGTWNYIRKQQPSKY